MAHLHRSISSIISLKGVCKHDWLIPMVFGNIIKSSNSYKIFSKSDSNCLGSQLGLEINASKNSVSILIKCLH